MMTCQPAVAKDFAITAPTRLAEPCNKNRGTLLRHVGHTSTAREPRQGFREFFQQESFYRHILGKFFLSIRMR